MEGKLHVISEGSAYSTLVYLIKQGIRPHNYIDNVESFEDLIPYLSTEDTILLIVRGLTDYTIQEVYNIIDKLEEQRDKLKRVIIMSNIPLGDIKVPYYFYEGDLVYGKVTYIDSKGRKRELDSEGKVLEEDAGGIFSIFKKGNEKEVVKGNVIMKQLINKDTEHKVQIRSDKGKKKKEERKPVERKEYEYIKFIDIYEENKE